MKILIAGGGIGGLTAALCLARTGHQVEVFEQAEVLGEIGAGLQISPNSSRVLHHLDLQEALQKVAFLPQATQFRHWRTGNVISESPLGDTAIACYGSPYYHIHRGDLLNLLAEAAGKSDLIRLHTAAAITNIEQDATAVSVTTDKDKAEGDLLVGADGIHSIVRAHLWGDEPARFTGNIAWRALVPAEAIPEQVIRPVTTAWWGPDKHFVHYFLRRGELVNCVCVVEKDGWEIESWTTPGDYEELKQDFTGWHPDLQMLIDSAAQDSLYKWALFDRKPMSRWGQGRITLLGDACHPTLPFMAQGAAMAVEDAWVLTASLRKFSDFEIALKEYERLRKPRTARIQNGSRRNAKTFHMKGLKAWVRDRAVRQAGNSTVDWLYRYNALNVL